MDDEVAPLLYRKYLAQLDYASWWWASVKGKKGLKVVDWGGRILDDLTFT